MYATTTRRKKNPMSTAGKIAIGVIVTGAVVGGGVAFMKAREEEAAAKKKSKKILAPSALSGVFEADARLMNAPSVVGDIQPPVYLRTGDWTPPVGMENDPTLGDVVTKLRVYMPDEKKVVDVPYVAISPTGVIIGQSPSDWSVGAALSRLVTDLTPDATKRAWELLLAEIQSKFMTGQQDWRTPEHHDAAIARVLTVIAQKADWTRGLAPYTYDSPHSRVWTGVQLLGTIANQSEHNKVAAAGG